MYFKGLLVKISMKWRIYFCPWRAFYRCLSNYLFAGIQNDRVKLGIFGQTAKFGQRPCLFNFSNVGIKNTLTKQTVKIRMSRLIRSRLIWIYNVCKCVSQFAWCPNLPDFTIMVNICSYSSPSVYQGLIGDIKSDQKGGTGSPDSPRKSQVIWVSIGNKQLDPPPPPGKSWTPWKMLGHLWNLEKW